MQRTMTCNSFRKARQCAGCVYNPVNQLGQPAGTKITPRVGSDGQCKTGVQLIPAKGG